MIDLYALLAKVYQNQELYMEKKFVLLKSNHIHSAQTSARSIIHTIVAHLQEKQFDEKMREVVPNQLTKEVMNRQVTTFDQAFQVYPTFCNLTQQALNINKMNENRRPLSAKIMKNPIKIQNTKKSLKRTDSMSSRISRLSRISKLYTRKSSLASVASERDPPIKKHHNSTLFNNKSHKFVKLHQQERERMSIYANEITDTLRQKKKQDQIKQKQKQNFISSIKTQVANYPKLQRKFLQQIGNKIYFYDKNGQPVEYSSKNMKKIPMSRINIKQEQIKQIEQRKSIKDSYIQYSKKPFKTQSTRQFFEVDASPKILFYPSLNCKYKVIS